MFYRHLLEKEEEIEGYSTIKYVAISIIKCFVAKEYVTSQIYTLKKIFYYQITFN